MTRSATFARRALPLCLLLSFSFAPAQNNAAAPAQSLSASAVIAEIVAATGVAPVPNTVDTIKAGDPDTPVTGIVTTFMDTFEVLQKAVTAGDNLIITHEPTFYNHPDDRTLFPNDPVVAAKLRYIEQHHLVVWRFHDLWHDRNPDGILEGEIAALGWGPYRVLSTHPTRIGDPAAHTTDQAVRSTGDAAQPTTKANHAHTEASLTAAGIDPDTPHLFHLPATTVAALATQLRAKTNSPVVRIVGDPATSITDVALLPGASGLHHQVTLLERSDVQLLVAGESAEWEAVEYVRDAAALARTGDGYPKALILLGHEPSEEAGMQQCATWLRTALHPTLPAIKIDFIPAGSPFTAVIMPAAAK